MKSKEELNAIKREVDVINEKLSELTKEELMQVVGGAVPQFQIGTYIVEGTVKDGDNIVLGEKR